MWFRFRRVSSGLVASIDRVIGQVENHEALVESTLKEVRRGAARAQVSLSRVRRDGEGLRIRLSRAAAEQDDWRRRALSCRETDEAKALECLRRAKKADREAAALTERLARHEEAERRLSEEVEALQARVSELQERHHQMRTRDAVARGSAGVDDVSSGAASDIESAFERWEETLAMSEIARPSVAEVDTFAREFEAADDDATLRAELEELGS
jgi:phage shock protein A